MSILATEASASASVTPTDGGRSRTPLVVATVVYATLVAWMTLGPRGEIWALRAIAERIAEYASFPLFPVSPLTWLFSALDFEVAANVLMFVPLGILVALWSPRSGWFTITMTGVAASCLIEITQFFLPGRVPDLGDVVANGLGMAIGSLCIAIAGRLDRVTPRQPAPMV